RAVQWSKSYAGLRIAENGTDLVVLANEKPDVPLEAFISSKFFLSVCRNAGLKKPKIKQSEVALGGRRASAGDAISLGPRSSPGGTIGWFLLLDGKPIGITCLHVVSPLSGKSAPGFPGSPLAHRRETLPVYWEARPQRMDRLGSVWDYDDLTWDSCR